MPIISGTKYRGKLHFGALNPRLSSYKEASAPLSRISAKNSIRAYQTAEHYGELNPPDRASLREGYKRYGFEQGQFVSDAAKIAEQGPATIGGLRDTKAPESTISRFWKDRSNFGAFNIQLLRAPKDLSPDVLGDLSPNGWVFKEWAKQNGFVTPDGKVDREAATASASALVATYDKDVLAAKKAKKQTANILADWLKYVAGEYRTPWNDDDVLGPAETTEIKYAESVYKDLVSSKYKVLDELKNSLRKFNESARLLTEGAARSAKQASPRARALLKRDIGYLKDFRDVVEAMMKDFSIVLSAPPKTPAPDTPTAQKTQPKPETTQNQPPSSPSPAATAEAVATAPSRPAKQAQQTKVPPRPAKQEPQRKPVLQWAPRSPYAGYIQIVPWEQSLIRSNTKENKR